MKIRKGVLIVLLSLLICCSLVLVIWFRFFSHKTNTSATLQGAACSYPTNMCSTGYECYVSVSGGLGPQGPLPQKITGGDQTCHKLCQSDQECGKVLKCTQVQLQREDITKSVKMCL